MFNRPFMGGLERKGVIATGYAGGDPRRRPQGH